MRVMTPAGECELRVAFPSGSFENIRSGPRLGHKKFLTAKANCANSAGSKKMLGLSDPVAFRGFKILIYCDAPRSGGSQCGLPGRIPQVSHKSE